MGANAEIKKKLIPVVEEYTGLTRKGDRLVGFCPIHGESGAPSFTIYPEQNSWYCYGCNNHGDVFNFVMLLEEISFADARKMLSEKFSIPLYTEEWVNKDALFAVTDEVTKLCNQELEWGDSPEAIRGRALLALRGVTAATTATFLLGVYTSEIDEKVRALFSEATLYDAGILSKNGYSYLKEATIVFPVKMNGHTNGFGYRTSSTPKYKNTPTTDIYKKRNSLFGFSQAKVGISKAKLAIVVEGYFDVLIMHQHGYTNTTAVCGTALTEEHTDLLATSARAVYLLLDGDSAGRKVSADQLKHPTNTQVLIATLPIGDPDEYLLAGKNLDAVLEDAKPAAILAIENALPMWSLTPAEVASTVRELVALLDNVEDPVERYIYLKVLEDTCGVPQTAFYTPCKHCGKRPYGK